MTYSVELRNYLQAPKFDPGALTKVLTSINESEMGLFSAITDLGLDPESFMNVLNSNAMKVLLFTLPQDKFMHALTAVNSNNMSLIAYAIDNKQVKLYQTLLNSLLENQLEQFMRSTELFLWAKMDNDPNHECFKFLLKLFPDNMRADAVNNLNLLQVELNQNNFEFLTIILESLPNKNDLKKVATYKVEGKDILQLAVEKGYTDFAETILNLMPQTERRVATQHIKANKSRLSSSLEHAESNSHRSLEAVGLFKKQKTQRGINLKDLNEYKRHEESDKGPKNNIKGSGPTT